MAQKRLVCNKYVVRDKIGGGAQGDTYTLVSLDNSDCEIKAGKFIRGSLHAQAVLEAQTLKMLKHKNVVRFYEFSTEADHYSDSSSNSWLIMEYCDGGDLAALIKAKSLDKITLTRNEIVNIFVQIMQGVRYLHSMQVIHRDIKPKNIFLSAGTVKIGDFGIAKVTHGQPTSTFAGTPLYMSPEILENESYTEATDLWSCGCVLYEICCLIPPFFGSTCAEITQLIRSRADRQPITITLHDGYFDEPFQSLTCLDPNERISASDFLETYFTEATKAQKTVLLVGMSGTGKSSLGNLLAGADVFKTSDRVAGCTREHNVHRSNETGITIIDTMGMADPNESEADIRRKISEALEATKDGVDLILFCMDKSRMTVEKHSVFKTLMTTFGEECRHNLCLVITRCGDEYVVGETKTQVLNARNDYLIDSQGVKGVAGKMFREVFSACGGRVFFVENPPKSNVKMLEEQLQIVREVCRQQLIEFIEMSNLEKFTSEAAFRARVEEERRNAQVREYQDEMKRQQEQVQTLKATTEELQLQNSIQIKLFEAREKYHQRRQMRQWLHEKYCLRKMCKEWYKLIAENSKSWKNWFRTKTDVDVNKLWVDHVKTCSLCKSCAVCVLENQIENCFANTEEMLAAIKAGCFDKIKYLEDQISPHFKKEYERHQKEKYAGSCLVM